MHAFSNCGLMSAGSLVVNYPFDDDEKGLSMYSKSPDDAVFQQLALSYSKVSLEKQSSVWAPSSCYAAVSAEDILWYVSLEDKRGEQYHLPLCSQPAFPFIHYFNILLQN